MTIGRALLLLFLFGLLAGLFYVGYLLLSSPASPTTEKKFDAPDTVGDGVGYCSFSEEDLMNKRIFTSDGKLVKNPTSPILCSECKKYVTKEIDHDDKCISMMPQGTVDDSASKNRLCDDSNPRNDKLNCISPSNFCLTGLGFSKKCSF